MSLCICNVQFVLSYGSLMSSRCKNLWRWAVMMLLGEVLWKLLWEVLWKLLMVMNSWLLKCFSLQTVHRLETIQIRWFSLNLLSSSSNQGLPWMIRFCKHIYLPLSVPLKFSKLKKKVLCSAPCFNQLMVW